MSFKYWCIDSLKIAEFRRNMQEQKNCTVMYIRRAYVGFINEKFTQLKISIILNSVKQNAMTFSNINQNQHMVQYNVHQ